MRQYVDRFAVANTVRMTQSVWGNSPVALVERDENVREVDEHLGPYDYHAIPAHSQENLIGAVALLAGDGQMIICARVTGVASAPQDRPVPLRDYSWIAGTPDEIARNARQQPTFETCLVVLPTDGTERVEAVSGREPAAFSTSRQRRGGASDPWDQQNERRVSLIRKRHRDGLTGEEQSELDRLQAEMSARINAVRPLPFEALESLERYVDEAERRLSDKS